jgi:triacylglycerol esterase/lipase EstA (alpha/beta hydrolase family)
MKAIKRGAALLTALSVACVLAATATAAPRYAADTPPAGANDWGCKPSAAHPNPVVLVHGLGANMKWNWSEMSPLLATNGYCVFALTYGRDPRATYPFNQMGGLVPMEQSSKELSAFVDRVLVATGAPKVDIVGHSEGSLMPNYYVKFLGGAAKVDRYVGITPVWDGTNLAGAGTLYTLGKPSGASDAVMSGWSLLCGSCREFVRGSEFLEQMNEGGAAVPGVTYTMLMTRYDELVVPYTSGILSGATNIVVQDQCRTDYAEHAAMAFDPVAQQDVLNALDPAHAKPPSCTVVLPGVGG